MIELQGMLTWNGIKNTGYISALNSQVDALRKIQKLFLTAKINL